MSTNVSSVASHFPDVENGFTTTTAGSVASGAATVTLNSVAGYTNGEPVVLVIEPTSTSAKQTFTGIIDTAGVQVTSVVWTAGTNQIHALGVTVVDYATATHIAMMSKGIKVGHTQKGNHKTLTDDNANEWIGLTTTGSAINYLDVANAAIGTNPVLSAKGDDSNIGLTLTPKGSGAIKHTLNYDAWVSGLTAPTAVAALGNRSYSLTYASSIAAFQSAGMRKRFTRTVAAPTQCTSLNGTTQYYSKTSPAGMTFTDDFTVSAWVKMSSYQTGTVVSRYNGTSGWVMQISSTGQVTLSGFNAGAANSSTVTSYQSLPLNKWLHITTQLDMSTFTATTTTSYIMIDGVDVPATVSRAGTNPTALIQAGNLEIGSTNGGTAFFPGKIAQVAIYNAKVTQATILASMSQTLSGAETSEISAYSFNNTINDLNANANNLTANGGAVATNADSPFGIQADGTISSTLEYGIITNVSSNGLTETVQVPEGCAIPTSGGVTAVAYSGQKIPYGFPVQSGKWEVIMLNKQDVLQVNATAQAWYNLGLAQLNAPIGDFVVGYMVTFQLNPASGTQATANVSLSTANNTESDNDMTCNVQGNATGMVAQAGTGIRFKQYSNSIATTYYLNTSNKTGLNTPTIYNVGSSAGATKIYAYPAHL